MDPRVLEALHGWCWNGRRQVRGLPSDAGAYLLLLRLATDRWIDVGAAGRRHFEAGWYVYAGSARGPGGLAARVGRHLRGPARVRWHVDHLRVRMTAPGAWVATDADSCAALRDLLRAGIGVSVPGIGCSDCPRCESHLLRLVGCDERVACFTRAR